MGTLPPVATIMSSREAKARFIPPMLLQRVSSLPEGLNWAYEVKFDGYRALAIKCNGKVLLRSRNNKDFSDKYPTIVKALAVLPDETVIDGEVVALDPSGRPSFNALQNVASSKLARSITFSMCWCSLGGTSWQSRCRSAAICCSAASSRR